jgi:hypothetical protein
MRREESGRLPYTFVWMPLETKAEKKGVQRIEEKEKCDKIYKELDNPILSLLFIANIAGGGK